MMTVFREIAVGVAITLLVVAAIVGSAKVALDYYFGNTCVSGFGTYNQACIDGK
jgi:hypothetical protein